MISLRKFGLSAALVSIPLSFTLSNIAMNSPAAKNIDCKNPVCTDQMKAFQLATGTIASTSKADVVSTVSTTDCPLDRAELGEKTWSLLHTIAAYYPSDPSEEQILAASQLINSLAMLYPCRHCADDFRESIRLHEPDVSSGKAFSKWLCEQHNIVNEKIGKPLFPCSAENLNERWRIGKEACWLNDKTTLKDEESEDEQ